MIETVELSKRYGNFVAVREVSFSIPTGEVVGLLGPNGAGKTTTMRMLTTFLPPTSGTATVAGFDLLREPEQVRKSIGYLPETPPLYPELRVRDFMNFVAKLKGLSGTAMTAAVNESIERCGLSSVTGKLCGQLSRGYRQRVGIAQALVHKPPVIILDEPTSGLDPTQIIEIRKLIADLKGGHTVVLSTHILSEVTETCSRAIIVAHGQVVVQGPLTELTRDRTLEQRFLEAVSDDPVHPVKIDPPTRITPSSSPGTPQ